MPRPKKADKKQKAKRRDAKDLRLVKEVEVKVPANNKKQKKIPEETRKKFAQYILEDRGYKITRYLGQGTYNTVYECKNPQGATVAAKVVMANNDDADDIEALLDEGFAAEELAKMKPINWDQYEDLFLKSMDPNAIKRAGYYYKHINLVEPKGIYEYKDGGKYYSIFEAPVVTQDAWQKFILTQLPPEDSDTEDAASEKSETFEYPPLDYAELKRMSKHTLKALVYLHSHGGVHLDIKPGNILIGIKPTGKSLSQLADMGFIDVTVGRDGTDNTESISWKGTEWFKAPEQLDGRVLAPDQVYKIDIYALGITLLQIYLTSKTHTLEDVRRYATPGRMRKLINDAPFGIERHFLTFVSKLTADDPKDRPTAAAALKLPFLDKSPKLPALPPRPSLTNNNDSQVSKNVRYMRGSRRSALPRRKKDRH